MNQGILIVLLLAIGIAGYFYYQYRRKQLAAKKEEEAKKSYLALARKVHDLLYPVNVAIEDGKELPLDIVEKLAANPESRFFLYEALRSFGKSNYFPKKYLNHEKSAESQLVHYLSHVHLLGAKPDELALVEKQSLIELEGTFDYYVFKFKVYPPHPDAGKGWMQGVVGPFAQNAPPYSRALATHSFRESLDTKSAQQHVAYAHANKYPKLTDLQKTILQLV